jgi:hypothetical protein
VGDLNSGSITSGFGAINNGASTITTTGTVSTGALTVGGDIDFNSGTIDLSTQTVDVTLNEAVDALNFDSNTLSIDASNNRVGIGTDSPAYNLDVTDESGPVSFHLGGIASTTGATINITNNAAKQYSANKNKHVINFITHIDGNITDGGYAQMEVGHSASGQDGTFIQFSTTPNAGALAERMRIDDAGDVTVSTGNLVIGTAGKGIDFSAATPDGTGTTGSEVLDDYETGTFTPTVAGVTLTTGTGTYTKIGNVVYIGMFLHWPTTTDATGVAIAGLPFTCKNDTNSRAGLTLSYSTRTTHTDFLIATATAYGNLRNLGGPVPTNADMSGRVIHVGGTYQSA